MRKKGEQKWRKRAVGEMQGNKRDAQRKKCGCQIQPCSSVGGPNHSSALSEESSRDKQGWGGKGGDEGT